MATPQYFRSELKTSDQVLKDFQQSRPYQSELKPPLIQINHGRNSYQNSQHNLSYQDMNNQNQITNSQNQNMNSQNQIMNSQNQNMYSQNQNMYSQNQNGNEIYTQQLVRSNIQTEFYNNKIPSTYNNNEDTYQVKQSITRSNANTDYNPKQQVFFKDSNVQGITYSSNKDQQQYDSSNNNYTANFNGMKSNQTNFNGARSNGESNMNQINNKLEEYQRNSAMKQMQESNNDNNQITTSAYNNQSNRYNNNNNNNNVYQSQVVGKEKYSDSTNKQQHNNDEQIKRSFRNQDKNQIESSVPYLPQAIIRSTAEGKLTSRERGQRCLDEQKKRFFTQGPEYLNDICVMNRNRGTYRGQVKSIKGETILEGTGMIEMSNGDIYIGQFWRNYMHGDGYLIKQNGDLYIGKFQNDKKHGFGKYYYANGDKYKGYFVHDARDSATSVYYNNYEDVWYEVPYVEDKRHGKGFKKDRDGNITNLEFFQDVQQLDDGSKIVQNFNVSSLHDFGNYVVSKIRTDIKPIAEETEDVVKKATKQSIYQIQEEQIEPIGQTYQKIDVNYEANLILQRCIQDKMTVYSYEQPLLCPIEGEAIYKFKDGSFFAGVWLNSIQNGYGIYFDSELGLYQGDFVDGFKSGYGKMNYFNGDYYEGNWVHDKKNDERGLYINYKKQEQKTGKFYNGKLLEVTNRVSFHQKLENQFALPQNYA